MQKGIQKKQDYVISFILFEDKITEMSRHENILSTIYKVTPPHNLTNTENESLELARSQRGHLACFSGDLDPKEWCCTIIELN